MKPHAIADTLTLPATIDCGDIIYQSAAATTLKPLDAIYHSALRFVTGDSFDTHHCILYQKVGWTLLKTRRSLHYSLFVYKALLHKLLSHLTLLLKYRHLNCLELSNSIAKLAFLTLLYSLLHMFVVIE